MIVVVTVRKDGRRQEVPGGDGGFGRGVREETADGSGLASGLQKKKHTQVHRL